jgi:pimeloyl-ACP methyl ester carboxylesterase
MKNQVDHFLKSLDASGPGCYALLSSGNSDTAVVFVHGFWGDSKDTWLQFQWMIDAYQNKHPWWKQCDLYFYQYSSFSESIDNSAHDFLNFLNTFFPKPPAEMLRIDPDPLLRNFQLPKVVLASRRYRELVLVGHSEGAIVIRRAVVIRGKDLRTSFRLNLLKKKNKSVLKREFEMLSARLSLFAPAMRGFAPSGWIGALLAVGRIAAYADPMLHYSTAFVEMQAKTVLDDLREDTHQLLAEFPWIPALRASILFGRKDYVVAKGEYFEDSPEDPVPNQGHVSICKPTPSYSKPLEFVAALPSERQLGAHNV